MKPVLFPFLISAQVSPGATISTVVPSGTRIMTLAPVLALALMFTVPPLSATTTAMLPVLGVVAGGRDGRPEGGPENGKGGGPDGMKGRKGGNGQPPEPPEGIGGERPELPDEDGESQTPS